MTNETPGTAMIAPRKLTAEIANTAAAPRPSTVGRRSAKLFCPPGLSAVTTTPTVAITIAITLADVRWSPRKTKPKIAVWIASVFM